MAVAVPSRDGEAVVPSSVPAAEAAALDAADVLARLGSGTGGLRADEVAQRLRVAAPNALRSHRVHAWSVLASQLRSPPRRGSDDSGNRMIITKGAPEGLLERCTGIPAAERTAVEAEFAAGTRVILRR